MIPEPLHPAIVHFPLVLAMLLPFVAMGALFAIRRDARPFRAWLVPAGLAALLAVSAFAAVRSGEAEEDRVEEVVGEAALHDHEEAAERFFVLSAVLALVVGGGLAAGTVGSAARWVSIVGSFVVLAAAVQTGDLGGQLVYRHGAAAAWTENAEGAPTSPDRTTSLSDDRAQDDDPSGHRKAP